MYCCTGFRTGSNPFIKLLEERRRLPRASRYRRHLSGEPFLCPSKQCDSEAPEIVALADKLRAEQTHPWKYAQAVYQFVSNEITYGILPPPRSGVVGTLERGFGNCWDKQNLLVALARSGGIPARFCFVGGASYIGDGAGQGQAHLLPWFLDALNRDARGSWLVSLELGLRRVIARAMLGEENNSGLFPWRLHPYVELKIGDCWIPADPTWGDEEAAGLGFALPLLGYDPLMLWGVKGNVIKRSEEIPTGWEQWISRRFFCFGICMSDRCANLAFEDVRASGRRILRALGRSEYIKQKRRRYVPIPGLAEVERASSEWSRMNSP